VGVGEGRRPRLANPETSAGAREKRSKKKDATERRTLPSVVAKTVTAAAGILIAGYVVSQTAEVIAEETGFRSSFVGAVLVAISTSLPEVSTVLSLVRAGLYTMASPISWEPIYLCRTALRGGRGGGRVMRF
jgi:cation:H+ antiporter